MSKTRMISTRMPTRAGLYAARLAGGIETFVQYHPWFGATDVQRDDESIDTSEIEAWACVPGELYVPMSAMP